ncbi:MAG: carboxypeptidase-like regulatory domain-containing protein [Marinifilaceae bacterium]
MQRFFILMTGFFLLSGILQPCLGQENQKGKYSFELKSSTLKQALVEISKVTTYDFSYRESIVKEKKVISYSFHKASISEILKQVLRRARLNYSIKGRTIILTERKELAYYTISGIITEKESGETLIGATLFSMDKMKGTVTNNYGFYSLTLPEGECSVIASFIGFENFKKELYLEDNLRLDIQLASHTTSIEEVVVKARRKNENIETVKMSHEEMDVQTIQAMPALLGETDVMKSLQMLPGVQSSGDATANLNVRGGTYDQNLILLDDAPIYNPSHALGFFSVFNPDAIKNVEIYKGGMPAQYGDRLSSVVDIRMKDGNMKEYHGAVSLGTIASRLTLEGPLKKDKASFSLSGRYSYAGKVADNFVSLAESVDLFGKELDGYRQGNDISFYDLNLKVNYLINRNNRLFFSAYTGRDQFYLRLFDEKSSMDWGNITSTLRWNHIFNDRLFSNTTLVFSNFDYSYYLKDDIRNFEWSSDLQEFDVKSDFDYFINPENHLKFGFSVNYHRIQPGKIEPRSANSITKGFQLDENNSIEPAVYFSHQVEINENLSLQYGLRYAAFANVGPGTVYDYASEERKTVTGSTEYDKGEIQSFFQGVEPRVNLCYRIDGEQSVKASYTSTHQYLHLLSSSSLGLPTDVWYPVSKHIKPQMSDQFALGYFRNFNQNKYETSVEAYYKKMSNQIDFKDNADLFLNPQIEQEILSGDGWSYGAEFLVKKQTGRLNGWLAYTWSKTEKKIEGINQGKAFPVRYDKRHDLSAFLNYKLNDRMTLSSNFVYATGGAVTAAKGSFSYKGTLVNHYSERNGYRLPNYHRLDLSLVLKGKQRKGWESEWVFAIYNVYNRHNAYSVYTKQDEQDLATNQSYMIYMFGAVPSVSYNVKF